MIKIFTSLSLFLLGMLAQAQTTQTRNVTKFTQMEVGSNIEITCTESATPSLTIDAPEGKLSNVTTEIKNGTLKIGLTNQDNGIYKVQVNANHLNTIKASGAKVSARQWSGAELNLILENGATFTGNIEPSQKMMLHVAQNATFNGRVKTQILNAEMHGNAKICLTGNAQTVYIEAYDNALCLAGNFSAEYIKVDANGQANVKLRARNTLDITVAEKARVIYTGNPNVIQMNENAIAVGPMQDEVSAVAAN